MTRKIKKGIALFLTVLMVVTMWTVPVYAEEGTVTVEFNGVNVNLKEGTVGENAASPDEDYTITIEVLENYEIYYTDVYAYGASEGVFIDFDYNAETGVFTITKETLAGYGNGLEEIDINIYAARAYDATTDCKEISSLPYSDEFVIDEKGDIAIGLDDSVEIGCMKLYEVELTEGQELLYTAVGTDTLETDLKVYLAKQTDTENMFEQLDYVDYDNKGMGEIGIFDVPETGTYVFIVAPFSDYYGDGVKFELEVAPESAETLDFMAEPAPVPDEDDLWAWDADTETLTLKDGFDFFTTDCAISVPDGTTINVEGGANILSFAGDAICGNGDITINLKKGASLNIEAGYYSIFSTSGEIKVIGEADEEGNLPVINCVGDNGSIVIENDEHYPVIEEKINAVYMENVEAVFTSYRECIYVEENTIGEESGDVVIENCILDFVADDETIQTYSGDIIITDCDSKIESSSEEGLYSSDDITITGGRMEISAGENCIDASSFTTSDTNFMLRFLYKDGGYDIINAYDVLIDGEFIVYDENMDVLHEGEMTEELQNMFNGYGCFAFEEEGTEHIFPEIVVSKYNGGTDDNAVAGVVEQYEEGEALEFTTDSEGMDIEYPIWAFTRFKARTWEIVDTDISGIADEEGNSVDISSLEPGTYTLKVRFEQQIFMRGYWAFYNNATGDKIDYVEVEFEILAAEEENPPVENDEGDVIPPPVEDDEEDVIPPPADDDNSADTGMENVGFVTIIVALMGVMIFAVKKNKQA